MDDFIPDGPECGQGEATPWIALAAAWTAGLALTAGWTVRTAWAVATRPDSRRYALTR